MLSEAWLPSHCGALHSLIGQLRDRMFPLMKRRVRNGSSQKTILFFLAFVVSRYRYFVVARWTVYSGTVCLAEMFLNGKQHGHENMVAHLFSCYFMQDPCRNGVREAVERCQHAGVKVYHLYNAILISIFSPSAVNMIQNSF